MAWSYGLAEAEVGAERRGAERSLLSSWLFGLVLLGLCFLIWGRVEALKEQRRGQIALWNEARRSPGFINLNEASVSKLRALPGVGPAMAARIRAWREEVGPFRTTDDLSLVPGIGNNRRERLRGLVTTEQR